MGFFKCFFFQAEDGIRGRNVTGVQTCALPISYESRSFDAQLFSEWGRLEWWSPPNTPGASGKSEAKSVTTSSRPRLEFFVRSGNTEDPGKEWSRWFGPYAKPGTPAECPAARFIQ